MAVVGAQRKHVTLPTDFRSPSVNGHSCYGHLTARFAPKPASALTDANGYVGWNSAIHACMNGFIRSHRQRGRAAMAELLGYTQGAQCVGALGLISLGAL